MQLETALELLLEPGIQGPVLDKVSGKQKLFCTFFCLIFKRIF